MKQATITWFCAFLLFGIGPLLSEENPNSRELSGELIEIFRIREGIKMLFQPPILGKNSNGVRVPSRYRLDGLTQVQINRAFEEAQRIYWDQLKTEYVRVYSESFTLPELQKLVSFYRSPIGTKWLEKQPRIEAIMVFKADELMKKRDDIIAKILDKGRVEQGAAPNP